MSKTFKRQRNEEKPRNKYKRKGSSFSNTRLKELKDMPLSSYEQEDLEGNEVYN